MIILIDTKNSFDKIQNDFMILLEKLGIEVTYLKATYDDVKICNKNAIYEKPIVKIISGETKIIPSNMRNENRVNYLLHFIEHTP